MPISKDQQHLKDLLGLHTAHLSLFQQGLCLIMETYPRTPIMSPSATFNPQHLVLDKASTQLPVPGVTSWLGCGAGSLKAKEGFFCPHPKVTSSKNPIQAAADTPPLGDEME